MREFLSDGVVSIHRYSTGIAGEVHAAALESVNEIYPWMPWCHPGYLMEEAQAWCDSQVLSWNERKTFEFVIRTVAGEHVGGGGINSLNAEYPLANLGYWVRTSQTRKDYATRAARLLAEFGLVDLALQRVEIVVAVENRASQRVAEKVGATREGILRNRLVLHSQLFDAVMYSVIPADLVKMRPAGN